MPEILDLGFVFCAGNARVLWRLAGVALLPPFLVVAASRYLLHWRWTFVWMFAVACGAIVQGVFTVAAGELLFDETVGARAILTAYGRRLVPYGTALLLSRATALVGVAIPFLARLLGYGAFVREAVLLERAAVHPALVRSQGLVKRQEGACFGVFVLLLLTEIVFVLVAAFLGDSAVEFVLQLGRPFGSLEEGGTLFALLGFFVFLPYQAVTRFLQYIDIRTRKEGWDIQIKFTALQAKTENRSPSAAVA